MAGVVDDVVNGALEVAVALAEVEGVEVGSTLSVVGVGTEDRSHTLTLCPNHFSYFSLAKVRRCCHPWLDEEEGI